MNAPCRSATLFRSLSAGLFWTLLIQLALALALVVALVLWPLTQQSADARAGVLVLAVQTWLELPQGTRADFVIELRARHGLELALECPNTATSARFPASYPSALQRALAVRMSGMSALAPTVSVSEDKRQLVACMELNGQRFSLRFAAPRLLEARLVALGLILLFSSLLAGGLALFMVRRVSRPLERVTHIVQGWGRGQAAPLPVKPNDVFEVCTLARTLEQMHQSLRAHENTRSILLAGISHDLRTPLARMRLALEMLPEDGAADLRAGLVRDVEAMDALITQTLHLARGLVGEAQHLPKVRLELVEFAQGLVDDCRRGGMEVSLRAEAVCHATIVPLALEHILLNILDNAWRYGAQQPVELTLTCHKDAPCFRVLDRGPGIPAHQREEVFLVFTRLEASRNLSTGGSGLGLAIARQWADSQGWRMGIDAREGGGSCVWLAL